MEKAERLETINPIQRQPPPGYNVSGEPQQQQYKLSTYTSPTYDALTQTKDVVPEEVRYVGRKQRCEYRFYVGCRNLLGLWIFLTSRLVGAPPALLLLLFIMSIVFCMHGFRNRTEEVESFKAILTLNHFIVRYDEYNPNTCDCGNSDESTICCITQSRDSWAIGTKLMYLKYIEIETCCCIETLNIYTGPKETNSCGCDDPDIQLICMEDAKSLQQQLSKARNDCREMIVPRHPAFDLIAGHPKL